METIFVLIRAALVPIPILVWTMLWPVWAMIVVCLVLPLWVSCSTTLRTIWFPFVIFGAAVFGDREAVSHYRRRWSGSYKEMSELLRSLDITDGYRSILAWWENPKQVETGGLIVGSNFVVALGTAVVFSEVLRTIVIVTVIALVVLANWPDS